MSIFTSGMVAMIALFGIAWMADTFIANNEDAIVGALGDLASKWPFMIAVAIFLVAALTTSQSAATRTMVPLGLSARDRRGLHDRHVDGRDGRPVPAGERHADRRRRGRHDGHDDARQTRDRPLLPAAVAGRLDRRRRSWGWRSLPSSTEALVAEAGGACVARRSGSDAVCVPPALHGGRSRGRLSDGRPRGARTLARGAPRARAPQISATPTLVELSFGSLAAPAQLHLPGAAAAGRPRRDRAARRPRPRRRSPAGSTRATALRRLGGDRRRVRWSGAGTCGSPRTRSPARR